MSTTPNVPYRLEFSVEVPGTREQVWQAIATAKGMSAWFLPTTMEEREGGSLHFDMGPEMGSDGQVTGWDPPHRLVYDEDWAALMGKDADALSPLTSEFLVEAQSGGTCVVRVTSSGFGTGAAWESEFWDDLAPAWMPFFDNLRLYLSHFPGQEASQLEVTTSHPGDAEALWSTLRDALGLGDEGETVEVRGATGTIERVGVLAHEGGPVLLVDEAARRLPCSDLAVRAHLRSHGEVQGAAFALLHLGRREPGAHALGGGDGLPDLLRGARDLDAELQAVRDVRGRAHALSSGSGWAATMSRCGRPSSWW